MDAAAHATDPEAVRDELRRILASRDFEASDRNRRFLSYVVEEMLNGRADRIKAYSIATSVFGRGADFDPQADSIVRIEAGRLRRALDRYYLAAGRANGLRIAIPRGGYVPVIETPAAEAAGAPARAGMKAEPRRGCTILVRPFEEEGDHAGFPNLSRALTRQVIVGLTRFTDLFVFGADTAFCCATGAAPCAGPPDTDLLLSGGTTQYGSRFAAEVLLSDARTGRCIWGDSFDRELVPGEIVRVRDEVANSVVRSLAQPYGVIFAARSREVEGKPPDNLSSYDAVVRYHQYARTFDPRLIAPVRDGLERAVRREPDYAEAWACLSLVCMDFARFGYPPPAGADGDMRKRALDLAVRAVELAPRSGRSRLALGRARWFGGDIAGGFAELRAGLSLNPNDTEIMSELGLRHAVLMQWDEALPLLEESYARNPAQPGGYRVGLALYHYMHGQYHDALNEMRRARIEYVVPAFVMTAAAAVRLGLTAEAGAAVQSILAIDPGYGDRIVSDLTARNVHPEIIAAMVAGLRDAGLPGRDTGVSRPGPAPAEETAPPAPGASR